MHATYSEVNILYLCSFAKKRKIKCSWATRNRNPVHLNKHPRFTFSLFLPVFSSRRSLGNVDLEPISLKGRSIKRYIVISVWHHLNQLIYNRIASVGPLKGPVSPLQALGRGRCRHRGLSLLLMPIDSHDMLLMRNVLTGKVR